MNDRRLLVLFAASSVVAIGLGYFVFDAPTGLQLVKFTGEWLMALTFVFFGYAMVKVLRACSWSWAHDRREWWSLSSVPLGSVLLLVHEPRGFKIIMDEIMLLGTSMSLHFDRLAQVPMRGHDIEGAFKIVDGIVDKRPVFFPFLLSLVHDATGYRPENAFLLNALLTVALLAVIYVLGRTLAGRPAAVAGVLLFSGLPLLAQSATGGGFDLLNAFMIALALWLALRFAATDGKWEATAFCFATILLAQTRYESVLFVPPCIAIIGWSWWRTRRVTLSWPMAVAPLLLLPVPWLMTVFKSPDAPWEMASVAASGSPMSLRHVGENIGHALRFFFAPGGTMLNSLLFSLLGAGGMVAVLFRGIRLISKKQPLNRAGIVGAVFGLALLSHFALLMVYFWGKLDDPVICRLSLPTHLLLVLALWKAWPRDAAPRWLWPAVGAIAAVQLWSFSLPAMANHVSTSQNVHSREVEWRRAFIQQQPQRDFLVIDPYSVVWLTHRISATSPAQATAHPEAIAHHLRARSFADVFVFQRFEVDPATGRQQVRPEFDLGSGFKLEPATECRLQPYSVSRISRVVAVRDSDSPGR